MVFIIVDFVFTLVICSYLYSPLTDVIDTFYSSADNITIAAGQVTNVNTSFAWHAMPVLILGVVIFGSILFFKNLITNRNNQG